MVDSFFGSLGSGQTKVGGMARYEGDNYHSISRELPGNPWFISTLWWADYLIRKEKGTENINEALDILLWVADHAMPSGVLPEQLHPHTGEPLSVSPLTWSHATFVTVNQRYMHKITAKDTGVPYRRMADWIGKLFTETCNSIHGACLIK